MWPLFVTAASLGSGCMAAWLYFGHIARGGPMGWEGLLQFGVMGALGLVVALVTALVLGLLGSVLQTGGRLLVAAAVLAVLTGGLLLPVLRVKHEFEARPTREALERYRAGEAERRKSTVPRAAPGQVPASWLDVHAEPPQLHVANRTPGSLVVRINRVLLREGLGYERCQLAVPLPPCDASSCGWLMHVELPPGGRRTFRDRCDARFRGAPLEFQVLDPANQKPLFLSESAFLPTWSPQRAR